MLTFMSQYQPDGRVFRHANRNPLEWDVFLTSDVECPIMHSYGFPFAVDKLAKSPDAFSVSDVQPSSLMIDDDAEYAANWAIERGLIDERPGVVDLLRRGWKWLVKDRLAVARTVARLNMEYNVILVTADGRHRAAIFAEDEDASWIGVTSRGTLCWLKPSNCRLANRRASSSNMRAGNDLNHLLSWNPFRGADIVDEDEDDDYDSSEWFNVRDPEVMRALLQQQHRYLTSNCSSTANSESVVPNAQDAGCDETTSSRDQGTVMEAISAWFAPPEASAIEALSLANRSVDEAVADNADLGPAVPDYHSDISPVEMLHSVASIPTVALASVGQEIETTLTPTSPAGPVESAPGLPDAHNEDSEVGDIAIDAAEPAFVQESPRSPTPARADAGDFGEHTVEEVVQRSSASCVIETPLQDEGAPHESPTPAGAIRTPPGLERPVARGASHQSAADSSSHRVQKAGMRWGAIPLRPRRHVVAKIAARRQFDAGSARADKRTLLWTPGVPHPSKGQVVIQVRRHCPFEDVHHFSTVLPSADANSSLGLVVLLPEPLPDFPAGGNAAVSPAQEFGMMFRHVSFWLRTPLGRVYADCAFKTNSIDTATIAFDEPMGYASPTLQSQQTGNSAVSWHQGPTSSSGIVVTLVPTHVQGEYLGDTEVQRRVHAALTALSMARVRNVLAFDAWHTPRYGTTSATVAALNAMHVRGWSRAFHQMAVSIPQQADVVLAHKRMAFADFDFEPHEAPSKPLTVPEGGTSESLLSLRKVKTAVARLQEARE
jgi:hypothetical protein